MTPTCFWKKLQIYHLNWQKNRLSASKNIISSFNILCRYFKDNQVGDYIPQSAISVFFSFLTKTIFNYFKRASLFNPPKSAWLGNILCTIQTVANNPNPKSKNPQSKTQTPKSKIQIQNPRIQNPPPNSKIQAQKSKIQSKIHRCKKKQTNPKSKIQDDFFLPMLHSSWRY